MCYMFSIPLDLWSFLLLNCVNLDEKTLKDPKNTFLWKRTSFGKSMLGKNNCANRQQLFL